jgi:hypothetical protein
LPADERVEVLLLIDQFEEVFTLIADEPARGHFLALLCAAVRNPRNRVRVISTFWVVAVAFSPDDRVGMTNGVDGARQRYVDYQDAVRYLCGKPLRDFSAEERAQFEIDDTQPTCPK